MIDSQLAAQILFNHRMASQDQIVACWPEIRADKDIAMVLVEKGILSVQTYHELAHYMDTLAAASPAVDAPYSPAPSGIPQTDPSIQNQAPSAAAETAPGGQDQEIPGWEDENWSAAPLEDEAPVVRKTTRNEHNMLKAAGSSMGAAVPSPEPFIESTPQFAASAAAFSDSSSDFYPNPIPAAVPPASPAPRPQTRPAGPADSAPVRVPESVGPETRWDELLAYARHCDAADLHLSAGNPILLRRYGSLQAASQAPMEQTSLRAWAQSALTAEQMERFEAKGDLEFIYTLHGFGRYRVTLLKQRRGWDITARVIPARIRSFEEAGLPESCRELTKWAQGLVLVTGPVGCGKSSTLATLVEMVNQERHDHVITIEDPIEIVYQPAHCRITQRQIGPHTLTRDAALRAALREDPDIIVISEMRDLDTIRLAVSAAETGHLVFGTMNTTNAARTLYRLIDSFPPEEQGIIRNMISESLRGVISQQLVPRRDGQGMVPAYEVLLINGAVANMIRKDEAHQLHTAMLTGKSAGMVLLDDSLRGLLDKGLVDVADVIPRATVPRDFEKNAGRK
jgi:twitching motility protein PilT